MFAHIENKQQNWHIGRECSVVNALITYPISVETKLKSTGNTVFGDTS